MATTDALARSIEDTKAFVDEATGKMNKASTLLDEDVALVNKALQDYEEVRGMVEQAKTDLSDAVDTLGEGVDAAAGGNVLVLAGTVAKGVAQLVDAMTRYTKAFSELQKKTENYKKAVDHNAQVVKAF